MQRLLAIYALLALSLTGLTTEPVQAESYLGLHVGLSKPMDFGDLNPRGSIRSASPTDFDMASGLTYGIKAGHYFATFPWLGVELDAANANPHLSPQYMTLTTTEGDSASMHVPGANLRIFTLSPLLMIRCAGDHPFTPYAGVGPAIAFARIGGNGTSDSDNGAVGILAKAGLEYHVTPRIGLFGEWRYTSVDLDLAHPAILGMTMAKSNYSNNAVMAGLSYHFGR